MKRGVWIGLGLLAGGVVVALAARKLLAADVEQPDYDVVARGDGFEVRRYGPALEAQVTVHGTYRDALQRGFRILAGFIFGDNHPRVHIDMTTPVTAEPEGQEIEMTAPVTARTAGSPERWTITFTMPEGYTASTLPEPDDPRIAIVQTGDRLVAARRFRWRATEERSADELDTLRSRLVDTDYAVDGEPRVAQYDPPWVPGPLRTNEVWLPLARGHRG